MHQQCWHHCPRGIPSPYRLRVHACQRLCASARYTRNTHTNIHIHTHMHVHIFPPSSHAWHVHLYGRGCEVGWQSQTKTQVHPRTQSQRPQGCQSLACICMHASVWLGLRVSGSCLHLFACSGQRCILSQQHARVRAHAKCSWVPSGADTRTQKLMRQGTSQWHACTHARAHTDIAAATFGANACVVRCRSADEVAR